MKSCVRDVGEHASVVALTGDFDIYSSPNVKRDLLALFERGRRHIVVNLEQVSYIDSTGIGALMDGLHRAQTFDGSISIVTRAEQMTRLFVSLGLAKVLLIFNDDETALAMSPAYSTAATAIAS